MIIEHVKTDVLCAGGGIGGLMAAIRAGELGADVLVAEKGHAKRSGKGGSGCDHYLAYIPEVHGNDMDAYIEQMMTTQQRRNFMNMSKDRLRTHVSKTYDIVKLWESWGLQMKTDGKYYFAGHASTPADSGACSSTRAATRRTSCTRRPRNPEPRSATG